MDKWLDTEEAAAYTGFAASTLEKYRVYSGGPKFAKRNRRVLYRVSDLDAWLGATIVSSTSELKVA